MKKTRSKKKIIISVLCVLLALAVLIIVNLKSNNIQKEKERK